MSDDYYSALTREAVRDEAERRVREGQPRAEVARLLGVPLPTMAQWAHAGRWRLKDLQRERAGELAEAAARRISTGHALDVFDRVRAAEVEEKLASAALEDAKRVQEATLRLAQARALLAEARKVQMRAIDAAYGFEPEEAAAGEATGPPGGGSAREVPDPS